MEPSSIQSQADAQQATGLLSSERRNDAAIITKTFRDSVDHEALASLIKLQADHRIKSEQAIIQWNHKQQEKAQFLTFSMAILSIICGTVLGMYGNPWTAAVAMVVGIGGPPAALALAKRINRQD